MLWQGQRQGKAEGGASTPQLFHLILYFVRIARATCPSPVLLEMSKTFLNEILTGIGTM